MGNVLGLVSMDIKCMLKILIVIVFDTGQFNSTYGTELLPVAEQHQRPLLLCRWGRYLPLLFAVSEEQY